MAWGRNTWPATGLRGGGRVCLFLLCWSATSGGCRVLLCEPPAPPLASQSLVRADPGYQSPAQLCRPAPFRLSISGCTCVCWWEGGGWLNCTMLCLCMCVRVSPISLPRRFFQSTPFIKVGQVCDWTLFYQKAIFRFLPISRSQHLRQWLHAEESPSPPFVALNLCWTAGECPSGWLVLLPMLQ